MKPEVRSQRSARASVLECGGSPPLFFSTDLTHPDESASGLAHSKTCRATGARDSSRLTSILRHASLPCLLISVLCLPASAQFSLDWWTVDGGGGTSSGGVYSVSGTIGQPDAGKMSGGNFNLDGGFWGIIATVQTPGAPYLTITRTNNTVVVSWPLPSDGWVLQATNVLPSVTVTWPQIPLPYQINGANLQFTEPTPTGNRFYRLYKP